MVHFIPPTQRRLALLAAQADLGPVLIYGGAGSGKGAIARWIHGHGPRAGKPFITAVQEVSLCEQLPLAQGGTIVIPELGEWNRAEQKILLHFLQTRSLATVCKETGPITRILNVRIMATTSHNLEGRAQGGLFNGELLQKLNVFRLEMPDLSKRGEEFDDIVHGIVGEITRELHKEHVRRISPDALQLIRSYEWPGNLRELRNVLRVSVIACGSDEIEPAHLPEFGHDRMDFRATREEFEKTYILELLKRFDWQVDRTCQMTRMDKPTLLAKIQRYGIEIRP